MLARVVPDRLPRSLSSRDVLNVLGMYPGDPGAPGGDCSGVVVRAGPPTGGSPALAVGQRVFGLAAGSLGSHVHASAHTLVPLPAGLSFAAAASMPTVFVTVDAALCQAAAMRPGERVLVHAAAGGVGLAAMQLIQAAGTVPLATAGSADKRALLRSLGVCHQASSRDLGFATTMCQLAGGADVALNTLTSPGMVAATLATLRRGGRFVEISKRDIWSAARVAQGEAVAWAVPACLPPATTCAHPCTTEPLYPWFRAPRRCLLPGGGGFHVGARSARCAHARGQRSSPWRYHPPALHRS